METHKSKVRKGKILWSTVVVKWVISIDLGVPQILFLMIPQRPTNGGKQSPVVLNKPQQSQWEIEHKVHSFFRGEQQKPEHKVWQLRIRDYKDSLLGVWHQWYQVSAV